MVFESLTTQPCINTGQPAVWIFLLLGVMAHARGVVLLWREAFVCVRRCDRLRRARKKQRHARRTDPR